MLRLLFGGAIAFDNARGKEKAETVPTQMVEESRDRNRPLKVFVSERERAGIEMRSAATGLSVSAYLRNLGLGFQPHSTLDQAALLALIKVNADQGRLGGLFKLWLLGQSAAPQETTHIRKLLAAGLPSETQDSYRAFDMTMSSTPSAIESAGDVCQTLIQNSGWPKSPCFAAATIASAPE